MPRRTITFGWVLVAMLAAMAFTPHIAAVALSPVFDLYDRLHPVVVMQGEVVKRGDSEFFVNIKGAKNRDCKYLRIVAYDVQKSPTRDVNIVRVDMPQLGATKPKGVFDIGVWRVWPIDAASVIHVYAQHDCAGRTVLTRISEIKP